jgi:hypothetical protein
MYLESAVRLLALVCVCGATALALVSDGRVAACRSARGACAVAGLPACGLELGPWQVVRSRTSTLPAALSGSTCVLRGADGERAAVMAFVPHPAAMSGDTLLSRHTAAAAERQHARLSLTAHGGVPDHWVFALAGSFIDVDSATRCADLKIRPPVNAGYALIGGNWEARPHGFYFERLADACVYDGRRPECGGEAPFIAHEFHPGESFALDLALQRDGSTWWLAAEIAARDASGGARALGRMRRAVPAPCWVTAQDPGRALVLVIPSPDSPDDPDERVEVSDFAWYD